HRCAGVRRAFTGTSRARDSRAKLRRSLAFWLIGALRGAYRRRSARSSGPGRCSFRGRSRLTAAVPRVGRRTPPGVAAGEVELAATAGTPAPGRGEPLPGAAPVACTPGP